MEQKAPKLGTALAAAVLGLGLPAMASAQDLAPTDPSFDTPSMTDAQADEALAPELAPVSDAIVSMGDRTQALVDRGVLSPDDITVVSLGDMGLTAEQRYSLMQQVDPSNAATLQQALGSTQVAENGSLDGYQRSLADHLTTIGVDPASVVAVNVDRDGTITIYTQ